MPQDLSDWMAPDNPGKYEKWFMGMLAQVMIGFAGIGKSWKAAQFKNLEVTELYDDDRLLMVDLPESPLYVGLWQIDAKGDCHDSEVHCEIGIAIPYGGRHEPGGVDAVAIAVMPCGPLDTWVVARRVVSEWAGWAAEAAMEAEGERIYAEARAKDLGE